MHAAVTSSSSRSAIWSLALRSSKLSVIIKRKTGRFVQLEIAVDARISITIWIRICVSNSTSACSNRPKRGASDYSAVLTEAPKAGDRQRKARNLIADPDRIEALRGRLDKALGHEPSKAPEAKRGADKEPEKHRDTNDAASRLHARMAELGKQVRKDDERDRDRTKDRDRDRGGPGR